MRTQIALVCAVLLAGCGSLPQPTPLSDLDKSAIATCGAGFDQGTILSLNAAVEKTGGTASAGFNQQARAAIFNSTKFSDPGKAYENFTSCVNNFNSAKKQ